MIIELLHGRGHVTVDVPDANLAAVLRKKRVPALADPAGAIRASFETPIGAPPLPRLAAGRKDAVIVISDITRPVPNRLILPPMLETLHAAGIPREAVTILVATGMHGPNTGAVLEEMVGPEIAAQYRIVNHDGRDAASHETLGTTPRGTSVLIDRTYCRADLKILTGLVEPHFMAGFSGGCKAIAPGCAHIDTIGVFHGYRMLRAPSAPGEPCADNGCVEDNPFQREVRAIGELVGADFLCNVVLDEERNLTEVFSGDKIAAHDAAIDFARHAASATLDAQADIVVTSCGGYPLDTTFYQCVKGLCNAVAVTRPGGTIVATGGCASVFGSREFEALLMGFERIEEFMAHFSDESNFTIDQWEVQMLERVVREREVLFHTLGIPAERLAQAFVTPAESVQAALEAALAKHGSEARIAVIPEGPYVLAGVS